MPSHSVLVFAALLQALVTSALIHSERLADARRLDLTSRFAFPLGYALLIAWSFV
jgi:hypothetical protein